MEIGTGGDRRVTRAGRWRPRRDVERSKHRDMWRAHPALATLLRIAAVLVPVAVSVLIAILVGRALPVPVGLGDTVLWWVVVVATATVGLVLTDRLARKLLPLAVLLELCLLFPDKAPSRLALVRGSGSSRDVARRVSEARRRGVDTEPVRAAEALVTLIGLLGLHDRRTRGHSERVRVYTDLISGELGLSREEQGKLRWAALLHDFGKLSVPAAVLNKSGEPSKDEWDLIYRHPDEGMRLAAGLVPWLGEWACAIGQHHEKYDGTGYPAGLTGAEIGLGARIVAVADAYEVMTAPRSYKRPMNASAAREELTRCAGAHFDPVVVRAFLNVSLGRMRWYLGPLSWLAQGPAVVSFDKVRHVIGEAAVVGAAAMVAGAAIVAPAGPLAGIADGGRAEAAQPPTRVYGPFAPPAGGKSAATESVQDAGTVPTPMGAVAVPAGWRTLGVAPAGTAPTAGAPAGSAPRADAPAGGPTTGSTGKAAGEGEATAPATQPSRDEPTKPKQPAATGPAAPPRAKTEDADDRDEDADDRDGGADRDGGDSGDADGVDGVAAAHPTQSPTTRPTAQPTRRPDADEHGTAGCPDDDRHGSHHQHHHGYGHCGSPAHRSR